MIHIKPSVFRRFRPRNRQILENYGTRNSLMQPTHLQTLNSTAKFTVTQGRTQERGYHVVTNIFKSISTQN
ncbi:hypothetical protein GIB67_039857 [Kingdonia uniflora]|uniref:Uncharacterized protein n=1 Tax=Kingdonia uniflora TaxID=39325 RepID=A0A7J7P376_9MAGN|nr:hypothetical protein GIB67_039857 [Kingdonia uniflora]